MDTSDIPNIYIILFIGIVIITVIVKLIQLKLYDEKSANLDSLLDEQARKRNGVVKKDWLFTGIRTLHINHNGINIMLSPVRARKFQYTSNDFTKAAFNLKKTDTYAEINIDNTVFGVKNYESVSVGSDSFKRDFRIKSNNPNLIINLFDNNVQDVFNNLKTKYGPPNMTIYKEKVTLTIKYLLKNEAEYDDFINYIFIICNRLKELGCC